MVVKMIWQLARKLALCVVVICLLCGVCSGQVSWNALGDRSASGRFFFGTSQNFKHCPSAWLVYLDKEHHSGGIFVVTGMEKFSKFEIGEDGTLLFHWVGLGDKNYAFKGNLKAGELVGEIQIVDAHSDTAKYACDVVATELPSQAISSTPEHPVVVGRYSNSAYSNEGGDPTGVDIRFFSTGKGLVGMVTFYEGYWDEPVDTPLALSQVEVDKGRIRFAAETPNGVARYHLLFTPTGVLFNRDDVAQENRGKDIPLKKSRAVLPAIGW